jgi:hypothetical protein
MQTNMEEDTYIGPHVLEVSVLKAGRTGSLWSFLTLEAQCTGAIISQIGPSSSNL